MIHITKTKSNHFVVVVTGKNGEPLVTSELLNSKQAAWKNVKAIFVANFISPADYLYPGVIVQDDTDKRKVWFVGYKLKKLYTILEPVPAYTPTKTKRRKG